MSKPVPIKCPECKGDSATVKILMNYIFGELFHWACFDCNYNWLETNTDRGGKVIKFE